MLYFIAIVAPGHVNEQVLTWKKYMEQEYGCKVALRSPAHITLVPPFSMSSEKEKALSQQLSVFCSGEKSFSIHLHHFDSFAPKVIFVHVEPGKQLVQLKHRLDEHLTPLKDFSFKKEQRPFHPHITIANRDLPKKDFKKAREYFAGLRYSAEFQADNISLLRHNNKEWEIAASFALL
jgi:2'-5' RNA ligase